MGESNGRMTNQEIHDHVATRIDELDEKIDLKLDGLKWRMIAALVGGQALAGLVAAVVTRTTPAEAAARAAGFLFG